MSQKFAAKLEGLFGVRFNVIAVGCVEPTYEANF
jgi:hypothetical protein